MDAPDLADGPAEPTLPSSRAAHQAATRRALLDASYRVFARDGYHGAVLEVIAREAGYSKGAVYSNFAGKADLFLQVLDGLLEPVAGGDWDPIAMAASDAALAAVGQMPAGEPLDEVQLSRGFGLATLELAAVAGRDPALLGELRQRLRVLVEGYMHFADRERAADERLGRDELGLLLAAFDQGFALYALVGMEGVTGTALVEGLRRLLQPSEQRVGGSGGVAGPTPAE